MVGPYLLGGLVEDLSAGSRDLHLGRVVGLFVLALVVQTFFVREVRLRGAMLGERDAGRSARGLPRTVRRRCRRGAGAGRDGRPAVPDHHRHRPARQRDARGGAAAGDRRGVGGAAARRAHRHRAAARARRADRPAAAAGRLPLVLPAGSAARTARRPPGTPPSPRALAETVDAGRTVEAHRLGRTPRSALSDRRIGEWTAWERYTLWLRSVLFPVVNVTHVTAGQRRAAARRRLRAAGLDQCGAADDGRAARADAGRPGRPDPSLVRRAPGRPGLVGPARRRTGDRAGRRGRRPRPPTAATCAPTRCASATAPASTCCTG